MSKDGLDIVLCSLEVWDEVWRRNQLLVEQILRAQPDTRFLFVEPPVDLLHSARRAEIPRGLGLRQINPSIWALRPPKMLPRAIGGPRVDLALGRSVLRSTKRLNMADFVLWVNDSAYAHLAVALDNPVVYDVTDNWLEASGTTRAKLRRRYEHAAMMGRADRVSVVSEALLGDASRTRNVVRIPDAVDAEHFQKPRSRPEDVPLGEYVAYVGTLHTDRIDVELCRELALGIAPVQFLLIGPDSLDTGSRKRLLDAGCLLVGPRPYSEIPAYYQHASLIAVPHVVTPFTESLDPIKLYECLAVGRPTITTAVAGMREAGPPIVAASRKSFVEEALDLLAERRPSSPRPVPSWADRASAMLDLVLEAKHQRETR